MRIKSYSPYENIGGVAYPPILAITSLNDTRVLYREPAKWIAKLQAAARGGPFLLKTEMAAGHGGRSGRYDAWHEEAFVLAWIASVVGATETETAETETAETETAETETVLQTSAARNLDLA